LGFGCGAQLEGGLDGRAFGPRHKPRCDSSRVPFAITH
jgi:hypothetical protein